MDTRRSVTLARSSPPDDPSDSSEAEPDEADAPTLDDIIEDFARD